MTDKVHCHVQIEYSKNPTNTSYADIESLDGFDPRNEDNRKLCHNMLDEYLDIWCERLKLNDTDPITYNEEGFHVHPYADKH